MESVQTLINKKIFIYSILYVILIYFYENMFCLLDNVFDYAIVVLIIQIFVEKRIVKK